jgi:hypothetical protein
MAEEWIEKALAVLDSKGNEWVSKEVILDF